MKRIFTFLFSILSIVSYAQDFDTISRWTFFENENLYVINESQDNNYCSIRVIVDGVERDIFTQESAFEIDLKQMEFEKGDEFDVQLIYPSDCRPHFLQNHIHMGDVINEFTNISVNAEGLLEWAYVRRPNVSIFIVESLRWGQWKKLAEVIYDPSHRNNYSQYKVELINGENKFRIRTYNISGPPYYSEIARINSDVEPITFIKDEEKQQIVFSNKTMYELYDRYDNLVTKGKSKMYNYSDIRRGVYTLNYGNTSQKIPIKIK